MADRTKVTVTVYEDRIQALAYSPETHDFIRDHAERAALALAAASPVRTGAGRASIRVRMSLEPVGWVGTASWSEGSYYLGILNARAGQADEHWADLAAATVRYV